MKWNNIFDVAFVYSLHQDVAHRFNVFVKIVWKKERCVSTGVVIIIQTTHTKPNAGVRGFTVLLFVTYDTYSCSHARGVPPTRIEPFLVTIPLQRCPLADQLLPGVTTQ